MTSPASRLRLEVCVDSLESAREAIAGGADRLEVCGSLAFGGGITPSLGLVQAIREEFPSTPIMAMVRPRTGDFVYSESEVSVMLKDIEVFKRAGITGVVLGTLRRNSEVDAEVLRTLASAARPMEVTFHRAFDMTSGSIEYAYGDITRTGVVTRILTSGRAPKITEGIEEFFRMAQFRASFSKDTRIPALLPGSGINPDTIEMVIRRLWPLGCTEYHLSGGSFIARETSGLGQERADMGMGDWVVWRTRRETVRAVRDIAETVVQELEGSG